VLILLIQAGVSCKWTNDSQHLLLENFDIIHNSPSHLYHCGLPLSPSSSWLHKYYSGEFSQVYMVVKGPQAGWGTCSRTVTLDSKPLALAYWRDTVAAGLQSSDIIILDVVTGSQVAVLSGHDDQVNSLTFSSGGTSIVSGSDDKTLKLWDVQTGGVVRTFHGHTGAVYSVSISSDYTTIASGSWDGTIRFWGIQTGECHHMIEQKGPVSYVSFSPTNPQHLMFVSGFMFEKVVKQWDIEGYQIGHTYNGSHAAFSLDGNHLVLSEEGGVLAQNSEGAVLVQNSDSVLTIAKCLTPKGSLGCCCFSPNGRFIAAAAGTIAYIWDITGPDPHLIETFIGHSDKIISLTFSSSSSLISASFDQSVKFWQIGALSTNPVTSDPKSTLPLSAPIRSITLQTKDVIAISSDLDGVVSIWDLSTGQCKSSFQTSAKGSYQRGVQLVNGRLILVWCTNKEIYIQDVEKSQILQTVDAPESNVLDIQISEDASKVFCLDEYYIQAWSVQTGEVVGSVGYRWDQPRGILMSIDGSRVWVHFHQSKTVGWDFGISGSSPTIIQELPEKPHMDLVCQAVKDRIYFPGVDDAVAGKKVLQLPARLTIPSKVRWDDQYLVAGYEDGDMLILELNDMILK
jgi:WD40 repeat protein